MHPNGEPPQDPQQPQPQQPQPWQAPPGAPPPPPAPDGAQWSPSQQPDGAGAHPPKGHPQPPGYPQVPGYPQAPGYPQTPGYPQASGYPHTPGHPQAGGYPQAPPPGYPQQQPPFPQAGVPYPQSGPSVPQSAPPFPQSGVPYSQSGPPAPQSGVPYPQSGPPVQHSVPPFTPPPQSGPPYAQSGPAYGPPGPQSGRPGPQFGAPGPQFGPPGQQFPPGPGFAGPRKGPSPVLIVLLAIVVAAVVLPVGFFGIRYATMQSGPYAGGPSMCESMNGETFTKLIGDTPGRDSYGDATSPQCTWGGGEGTAQSYLSMLAQFGTKHWLQGDSLTDARELYTSMASDDRVPEGRLGARTDVTGLGDEGRCTVETTDRVNVTYNCVLRDGNLVLSMDVSGPYVPPETLPEAARLDEAGLRTALDAFWAEIGRNLMEDYLEELR